MDGSIDEVIEKAEKIKAKASLQESLVKIAIS